MSETNGIWFVLSLIMSTVSICRLSIWVDIWILPSDDFYDRMYFSSVPIIFPKSGTRILSCSYYQSDREQQDLVCIVCVTMSTVSSLSGRILFQCDAKKQDNNTTCVTFSSFAVNSDFGQLRTNWIKTKTYCKSVNLSWFRTSYIAIWESLGFSFGV